VSSRHGVESVNSPIWSAGDNGEPVGDGLRVVQRAAGLGVNAYDVGLQCRRTDICDKPSQRANASRSAWAVSPTCRKITRP
jgi:hypothetical protein